VVPLVSETELRLFSGFGRYGKAGWSEQTLRGEIEWRTSLMPLKDESAIREEVRSVFADFWEFTLEPIKKRLSLAENSDEEAEVSEVASEESHSDPVPDTSEENSEQETEGDN